MTDKELIDWARLMLGEPIIKLEIDDEQVQFIIDTARTNIKDAQFKTNKMVKKAVYNDLVREGVLALSCLMLDRINGAFAHPVEEEWYRGGKEKVEAWKEKLKEIKE